MPEFVALETCNLIALSIIFIPFPEADNIGKVNFAFAQLICEMCFCGTTGNQSLFYIPCFVNIKGPYSKMKNKQQISFTEPCGQFG